MLAASTLNDLSNHNYASSASSYPYSSQPTTILPPQLALSSAYGGFHPPMSPITHTAKNPRRIQLKNSQICSTSYLRTSTPHPSISKSSTTVPNVEQFFFFFDQIS